MKELIFAADVAALLSALAASWFWLLAGGVRVRRISKLEQLDHADINRIVVALNRSSVLNRRAALASFLSAAIVALRIVVGMLTS